MDARYAIRKAQLLEECQVAPEIFQEVMPRLQGFMAPFIDVFSGQAPKGHALTYVQGLLSNVERKNIEPYPFGKPLRVSHQVVACRVDDFTLLDRIDRFDG